MQTLLCHNAPWSAPPKLRGVPQVHSTLSIFTQTCLIVASPGATVQTRVSMGLTLKAYLGEVNR
jgi:hypothetical protein